MSPYRVRGSIMFPGKGVGPGFSLSGGALPQGVWGNRPLFGGGPAVFFYRKNAYLKAPKSLNCRKNTWVALPTCKNIRIFCSFLTMRLPFVVKMRGVRVGGATTCQYLSLFHVGAPLWACYAGPWNADLVAISRRCATLGLFC